MMYPTDGSAPQKQGKMKRVAKIHTRSRALVALLKPTLGVLAAAVATLPISKVSADEVDLTTVGVDSPLVVTADVGGNGLVANFHTQPAGTGVFDPFLTIERDASGGNPSGIESGYNTDGHTALYLDQQRPEWNTLLKLSDLAIVDVNGKSYYAFELDANEPGADKSLISVDNIRIYTSASDNTAAVGNDVSKLEQQSPLGTLRWAMNDPLKQGGYNIANWIKLDANQSDVDKKSNGGSGISDMILYVPTDAFKDAIENGEDNVWFYNLNGVHYVVDGDLAAQAGYEEWRAVTGPNTVPDGGNTLVLFGTSLAALGFVANRRKAASQA
jgi:hypothetical protein